MRYYIERLSALILYYTDTIIIQAQAEAHYGIDWNAPLGTDEDADAVELPTTRNPLTVTDYVQLQQVIDPYSNSDDHGIDQYLLAVDFVEHKVSLY